MPTSGPMILWSAFLEISVSCSTRLSIPVVRKQMTASRGVSTIGSPLTLNDVLISTGMPVNASNSLSSRYNIGLVCSRTVCTRAVPSTWTIAGILSCHSGRTCLAINMNGDSSSPSNTSLARSASTIGANGRNACRCLTRWFRISFISGLRGSASRHIARHVLIDQPLFHFRDGQDVTISNDQIDIIKRDAFRIQAIIDHFLVETGGVLFTRNSFLGDGECHGAVAQQAGAHIIVIGIQAENVGVLFGHRHSWIVGILIEKTLGRRSQVCLLKMAFAKSRLPNH